MVMAQRSMSARQPYPSAYSLSRSGNRPASEVGRAIERLVQPEVWTMFDTVVISPSTASGVTTTNVPFANFTNVISPIAMFNSRNQANAAGLTSMTTTSGYVDWPYKAYGIGAGISCDTDVPSAGTGIATAVAFVESLVNGGMFTLTFAGDAKYIAPIADLPAGGGVVYGSKTRTQAFAANSDSASASNGAQTVQARALWSDYILFRGQASPFSVAITLDPVSLARVQALTPLTGNFSARIQIKFWGYRGKGLVNGAPFRGSV